MVHSVIFQFALMLSIFKLGLHIGTAQIEDVTTESLIRDDISKIPPASKIEKGFARGMPHVVRLANSLHQKQRLNDVEQIWSPERETHVTRIFYKKRKNQNSGKNHWNSWIINETTRLRPHCVVPIRAMERSTQDNTSKIFFSSTSSFTAGFCSHQSPSLLLVIVATQHMFAASFNIRLELGRKYEFRDFTHKCLLLASTKSPQSPISSRAYFHYKL